MNTKVNLAGVELKNPVMTASGTFGSGMEYGEYVGAVCLQQRVRMEFAQVHRLERVLHRAVIVLAVEIPFSGPIPGQGLQGPAFSR